MSDFALLGQVPGGQKRLLIAIQRVIVMIQQPIGGAPHSVGMLVDDRGEIAHERLFQACPAA